MLTAFLALVGNSAIADQTSANYRIVTNVLAAGGGDSNSTGYSLSSVIAQSSPVSEYPSSSNYLLAAGFWAANFNQLPPSLQFSAAYYDVNEGDGSKTIIVTRTGSSAVSVDYATTDDTAIAGSDYTAVSDTLSWVDGDTTDKQFTIDIIDDAEAEDDKQLFVSLGNPIGATLGTPDTAAVIIHDNDSATEFSTLTIAATGEGKLIVKAKPNKGFKFKGWGDDCQGSQKKKKLTVPVDSDSDCTVLLVPKGNLDVLEESSVTPSDNLVEEGVSILRFNALTGSSKLILIAKPNQGFKFKGWSGDCKGKKKTKVSMDSDLICTAKFVLRK
jgi:hypothetical protein